MLAAAEVDNGTVVSILFAIIALVSAWIGWARWAHKTQTDTAAVTTTTLREFIRSQESRLKTLEDELKELRGSHTNQAAEIATLKEKVRQLESHRDHLLAENHSQKVEIVALNVRIAEQVGEINRLNGELAKAADDAEIQAALQTRLKQQLDDYEKKAGGIVGA